jgi:antitoxin YafN
MATYTVLTDQTVSITDLRKHPARYFKDTPVVVLSNNKPAGYLLSADLFERLMGLLEQQEEARAVTARFRPSALRLKAIAAKGGRLLQEATDEQLGAFSE